MTVDSVTDAEVFGTYINNVLVPTLHRGDVVTRDNIGSHEAVGIAQAIASAGARFVYLPPYSM